MRLSESLRKGVLEAAVGGVMNKFKIQRRRDTFFFEELISDFIFESERRGFGAAVEEMGRKWGYLNSGTLLPDALKMVPPLFIINTVMKKVWQNLGLVEDIRAEKAGVTILLRTAGESVTRMIGPNRLTTGMYAGIISQLFGRTAVPLKAVQGRKRCEYTFGLREGRLGYAGRPRDAYMKLNKMPPAAGHTLKDALRTGIFRLSGNRIYFRGRLVTPVENTIFHLLGESGILRERIPCISHDFFSGVAKGKVGVEERLSLAKALFQVMGWGVFSIVMGRGTGMTIEIKNPPCSLAPSDNWDYLALTLLGYLWLIDRRLTFSGSRKSNRGVSFTYSFRHARRRPRQPAERESRRTGSRPRGLRSPAS